MKIDETIIQVRKATPCFLTPTGLVFSLDGDVLMLHAIIRERHTQRDHSFVHFEREEIFFYDMGRKQCLTSLFDEGKPHPLEGVWADQLRDALDRFIKSTQ